MTQSSGPGGDGADLIMAPTQSTPSVRADWQAGSLEMAGESYPENTYEIFEGIITWVQSFLEFTTRPLRVELELSYLNTSSIRAMIDIFDQLEKHASAGRGVSVLWLYDGRNPRSAELGEEFKEDYTFQFDIVAIPV